MAKEKCEICKFWSHEDTNAYGVEVGKCLRYPPRLDEHRVQRMAYENDELKLLGACVYYDFPFTAGTEWCGEFKADT